MITKSSWDQDDVSRLFFNFTSKITNLTVFLTISKIGLRFSETAVRHDKSILPELLLIAANKFTFGFQATSWRHSCHLTKSWQRSSSAAVKKFKKKENPCLECCDEIKIIQCTPLKPSKETPCRLSRTFVADKVRTARRSFSYPVSTENITHVSNSVGLVNGISQNDTSALDSEWGDGMNVQWLHPVSRIETERYGQCSPMHRRATRNRELLMAVPLQGSLLLIMLVFEGQPLMLERQRCDKAINSIV